MPGGPWRAQISSTSLMQAGWRADAFSKAYTAAYHDIEPDWPVFPCVRQPPADFGIYLWMPA